MKFTVMENGNFLVESMTLEPSDSFGDMGARVESAVLAHLEKAIARIRKTQADRLTATR